VTLIAELVDELAEPLPGGGRRVDLIRFVPDRPGHDFRYAMDISKIARELGKAMSDVHVLVNELAATSCANIVIFRHLRHTSSPGSSLFE